MNREEYEQGQKRIGDEYRAAREIINRERNNEIRCINQGFEDKLYALDRVYNDMITCLYNTRVEQLAALQLEYFIAQKGARTNETSPE